MIFYQFMPRSDEESKREIDGIMRVFFNDWKSFKNRVKPGDRLILRTIEDIYPFYTHLSDFFKFLFNNEIWLYVDDAYKRNYKISVDDLDVDFGPALKVMIDLLEYLEEHPRDTMPTGAYRAYKKPAVPLGRPPKTKELEKAHRLVKAWEKAGEKPNVKMACELAGVTRQAYYNYIKSKGI